jgi:hypothetical protein
LPESATTTSDLRFTVRDDGATGVELLVAGQVVSFLLIIPLTIAVGRARVKVDGIGGVETVEAERKRGYSRRVLEGTVRHMRQGPAALSMLYGIPDFYPKFGFATAGPDYALQLRGLSRPADLPAGWTARNCRPDDVPVIQRLYAEYTARAVGAVQRAPDGRVWSTLAALATGAKADDPDECRVVVGPSGQVDGYAWRGKHFWPVTSDFERAFPDSLVIGEVIAASTPAADAVLAVCRAWGAKATTPKGEPVKDVVLSLPPEGPLYAATLRQDARMLITSRLAEDFMARTLDVARLLRALAPELTARRGALSAAPDASLRLETEVGAATLHITAAEVRVTADEMVDHGPDTTLRLPQTELMRLALGALPPADVLNRLDPPPDDRTRTLVEGLFPQRRPYLHLPDRI